MTLGISPLTQDCRHFLLIVKWMKEERNGGRKDRRIELGEEKRRGRNDGDTGRNEEHKG